MDKHFRSRRAVDGLPERLLVGSPATGQRAVRGVAAHRERGTPAAGSSIAPRSATAGRHQELFSGPAGRSGVGAPAGRSW